MTRTQRLLTLLQILKENRYPVTADSLASQLQISVRSVYRDIETLRCQGAEITGEAGRLSDEVRITAAADDI